jgi:histidyl-tRNA synthetase
MAYTSLKGFRDILPAEAENWRRLETAIHSLVERYGYGEIRLPIVESTELFKRGVGEGTDIVGKEMYTFFDKSDPPESITLRPELTASAARAFAEHDMGQQQALTRWYYIGSMFRYEQPQAGRYRQFSQFGIELYGSSTPDADAEVITVGVDLLQAIGVSNHRLRLNSIGTVEERMIYRGLLLDYLRERTSQLSPESQRRMEGNPLRVLDSKREEDIAATADAPQIINSLGDESREHFERVCSLLDAISIPYTIDHRLVRGLDYYTRTAFEYQGLDLGAQDALGGGGRYDGLLEQIGGKPTPAVGFSFGMERLLIAMTNAGLVPEAISRVDAYLIGLDPESRRWCFARAHELRQKGLTVETDLLGRSMKAQMRDANRKGAGRVVIVGGNELAEQRAEVKELSTGTQESVAFDDIVATLLQSKAS